MIKFKRFLSTLLAVVIVIGLIPLSSITANATDNTAWYNARVNQTLANISSDNYNSSNPFSKGQCTWYCFGRSLEKCGVYLPAWKSNGTYGNADEWYDNAAAKGFSVGYEVRSNSIACFSGMHVIFVEWVDGETVYYTEANKDSNGTYNSGVDCILVKSTITKLRQRLNSTYQGCIYLDGGGSVTSHTVDSSYGTNIAAYPKAKITAANIFDANHNQIGSTAWIGTSDLCTVHEVYTDGCCKVTYPLDNGGSKTVYSKISLFRASVPSVKYWVSSTEYGDEISQGTAGNSYYLCYYLYDKISKKDWDEVVSSDYEIRLTIYNPDGSVNYTNENKFDYDRSWIRSFFGKAGTYRVELSAVSGYSGSSSKSFVVKENPIKVNCSTNSVSLKLGETESQTIYAGYSGYYDGNWVLNYQRSNSNVSCTWGEWTDDHRSPLTIKANAMGTTTVTISIKDKDTGTVLDSTTVTVSVDAKSYTVSYNANGGSGAPNSQTKTHGTNLTLSSSLPTGKSYSVQFNASGGTVTTKSIIVSKRFREWNTKLDGSGTAYSAGGTYSTNSAATLYAQWDDATLSTALEPTREGYYFKGWYDSASVDSNGKPLGNKYTTSTVITKNITLYAMWEKADTLYFGDLDKDGSVSSVDVLMANKYRLNQYTPEYDINEFSLRGDLVRDGELELNDIMLINNIVQQKQTQEDCEKAIKKIEVVNIPQASYKRGDTLNTKGVSLKITFDTGTAYTLTDGLTVSGYDPYQIGIQTLTVRFYQFSATYDVEVKAPQYTISYNANGGSGAPGSQIKTYDVNLTLSSTKPTRLGYTFLGWSTSSTATSATYQAGSSFSSNANTTLYAVWKANTYTVSYNANGGSGAPSSQTKTYGVNLTLSSTKPTRPGYTFLGWSTSSTATSATYQSGGSFTSNANTTLYAVWKANTYTISYNANGGSGAPSNQTKTHGVNLTLSSTKPTRPGYTFLGWATSSTATSATYQPSSSFTGNTNTTLYAVWKQGCENETHSYSYTATKAPTTSATGTLTGTCSKCSGTTNVTLPKLNTTDYTYKVTKAATCAATGTGRYTWKTTTYGSFYFDVTIPATGHTYTNKVTAPTCTAQGYTTHTCSCGYSYKDTYINATGHSYTYKVTKAPTASATGTLTGTCAKCSGTTTVTLPKLTTTDYTYKVTKAATCAATGTGRYTWKTTTYGSFYFDVTIAKGAHNYTYKATKAPTTSATGTLTGTCSKCSGTTTVTLPKLSTTDYNYSVRTAATCTVAGSGRYTWKTTTYGSFYFDVSISATGHNYSNGNCTRCGATDPNYVIDQNAPIIMADTVNGKADETVTVTVSMKNNPGFGGMAYDIEYDSEILELVSYEIGLGNAICTDSGVGTYTNKVNLQYAGTSNITGDGTLVTLTFKIKASAPEATALISIVPEAGTFFTYEGRNEKDFNVSCVNGGVKVVKYISGDINGDGKVNNRDAARLLQKLAGWDVDYVDATLDVNGDGKVNNRDAARILQHLAGWDVELH